MGVPGPGRPSRGAGRILHVVIEEEFVGVRAQAQGVMFLAFGGDPHFEEVAGEHVAFEQEFVVGLEAIEGFAEAAGDVGNLLKFLGG